MSAAQVTVAIPVLDGGSLLAETLEAVGRQRTDRELELVVADSGSSDGSRERAVGAGARVLDVPAGQFSHGGTRNMLMRESAGTHVAFLTQDSTPADEDWLQRLLDGFELGDDVGLVFGPYLARPWASPMVRRELDTMFASFAPDGDARVDRQADPDSRRRTFFTDANGCVARSAWERVPFRAVSYAEDQMLAGDMLAAGWAKAYQPAAGVLHSHDYRPSELLRRSFDEGRALREVHGHRARSSPVKLGQVVQRHVRDDLADSSSGRLSLLVRSVVHHAAKTVGGTLGSHADRVPRPVRRRLSLEGRDDFQPQC